MLKLGPTRGSENVPTFDITNNSSNIRYLNKQVKNVYKFVYPFATKKKQRWIRENFKILKIDDYDTIFVDEVEQAVDPDASDDSIPKEELVISGLDMAETLKRKRSDENKAFKKWVCDIRRNGRKSRPKTCKTRVSGTSSKTRKKARTSLE